jgi:hypothetical protein
LGFREDETFGDHRAFSLKVIDHPDDPVTLHASVDAAHLHNKILKKNRQRIGLLDDEMWERACSGDLTPEQYQAHLRTIPKEDLVLPILREVVLREKRARQGR